LHQSLNKELNDRNVTNSDQRLLCVTANIGPPNDPSKNGPAAAHPTAALGHSGHETCISVNAACVASPPMTYMWTTYDDLCLRWRRRAAATVIGSSWLIPH